MLYVFINGMFTCCCILVILSQLKFHQSIEWVSLALVLISNGILWFYAVPKLEEKIHDGGHLCGMKYAGHIMEMVEKMTPEERAEVNNNPDFVPPDFEKDINEFFAKEHADPTP